MIPNAFMDIDVEIILKELTQIENLEYSSIQNIINEFDDTTSWNALAKNTLINSLKQLDEKRVNKLKNDASMFKTKILLVKEYLTMYEQYESNYNLMLEIKEKMDNSIEVEKAIYEEEYFKYLNIVKQMENELIEEEKQIYRDLI